MSATKQLLSIREGWYAVADLPVHVTYIQGAEGRTIVGFSGLALYSGSSKTAELEVHPSKDACVAAIRARLVAEIAAVEPSGRSKWDTSRRRVLRQKLGRLDHLDDAE